MGAPSDSIRTHLFTCSQSQGLLKNSFPYLELEVAPGINDICTIPLFKVFKKQVSPPLISEQKSSSLTKGQSTLRRCWQLLDADTLANLFLRGVFNLTLKSPMLVRVATNFFLRVCLIITSQSNFLQAYPLRRLTLVYLMQSLMILVHLCGK